MVTTKTNKPWSEAETSILLEGYRNYGSNAKQKNQYKQWSDAETSMLIEGYRNYGPNAKQLMKMFGDAFTEQQIRDKIKTLRLNGHLL